MNIVPLNDHVILKKIAEEEATKKGILLMPSSLPKQDRYEVISFSSDVDYNVEVGSIVYVEKYKGQTILQDGIEYLIVKIEDIIAYERQL